MGAGCCVQVKKHQFCRNEPQQITSREKLFQLLNKLKSKQKIFFTVYCNNFINFPPMFVAGSDLRRSLPAQVFNLGIFFYLSCAFQFYELSSKTFNDEM